MCECVCIFITCYSLHYRSKIKQSPPQQNPVYNRKPWEGFLHVWPVQKDSYPIPPWHFCWMPLWLMKTHPGTWCLTYCSLQKGQDRTAWCSPVPHVLCHTSLYSCWLLLGPGRPSCYKVWCPRRQTEDDGWSFSPQLCLMLYHVQL